MKDPEIKQFFPKKGKLEQAKYGAEDALESLLKNPKIPESIKKLLSE